MLVESYLVRPGAVMTLSRPPFPFALAVTPCSHGVCGRGGGQILLLKAGKALSGTVKRVTLRDLAVRCFLRPHGADVIYRPSHPGVICNDATTLRLEYFDGLLASDLIISGRRGDRDGVTAARGDPVFIALM